MPDDFAALTERDHWLGWLGDDPTQAVRNEIETILREQEPTATLQQLVVAGEPAFLTGGRKIPGDPNNIIVTRAGLAVSCEIEVRSEKGIERLRGTFS